MDSCKQENPARPKALKRKAFCVNDGDNGSVFEEGGTKKLREASTHASDTGEDASKSSSNNAQCCSKCQEMTGTSAGLHALINGGYKHLNWYQIQGTAALGCALCRKIQDLPKHWVRNSEGSITHKEVVIRADHYTFLPSQDRRRVLGHPLNLLSNNIQLRSLEVQIPTDDRLGQRWDEAFQDTIEFHLVTRKEDLASHFVPGRRETKSLSPEVVSAISRQLDVCFDKHSSCPRRCTPKLPRRVLDLGAGGTSIRLYQPNTEDKAHYATLSYCWGGTTQSLTTTTSTFEQYSSALPCDLPKTISDAIEVCRNLNLRYLWVDAFCILQDDASDKLDQIAKMGSIYKNSTIAIVAASAEKVTDGFLEGKPNEPSVQLPFFIDNITTGTVYLRTGHDEVMKSSDEPIFKRGWTFQELMLSPRALVFDSSQITFKCRKEDFHSVVETHLGFDFNCQDLPTSVFGSVEHIASRETQESLEEHTKSEQTRMWPFIMCEYSRRDLTLFEDRLPALAGVAAELAEVWNDTYLAGVWKRTLMLDLAWYRFQDPEWDLRAKSRFTDLNPSHHVESPSWSWITVPYPIHIDVILRLDARLIDSHVEIKSKSSPFGHVNKASITLDARVLNASDLDLTPYLKSPSSQPEDHFISFDFDDSKSGLDDCRLVYLGHNRTWHQGIFLIVRNFGAKKFQRVGYARLSNQKPEWKLLLFETRRETIVLE